MKNKKGDADTRGKNKERGGLCQTLTIFCHSLRIGWSEKSLMSLIRTDVWSKLDSALGCTDSSVGFFGSCSKPLLRALCAFRKDESFRSDQYFPTFVILMALACSVVAPSQAPSSSSEILL